MTDVLSPAVDLERGLVVLGGRRLVFHCHHYNVYLQRTLEEGLKERAAGLLVGAGMEAGRAMLGGLEEKSPSASPEATISRAVDLFRDHGFGVLDATGLGVRGGEASVERSHYAVGWLAKWGRRGTPCCFFPAGFVGAAVSVAGKLAPERIVARETECLAAGAERCRFIVEVW
jgi:predicted hydrocarbon binding protein